MVRVTEGPFFSEVAVYYQHVQEVVRLYNVPGGDSDHCAKHQNGVAGWVGELTFLPLLPCLAPGVDGLSLEVSCLVDIRDHINKELVLRFSTDIESQGTFFTDLNGFQVKRKGGCMHLPC